MPTFRDPTVDAGEVAEALRGLAHASRSVEHPHEMYGILGRLLSGVGSLRQILDQLADAHVTNLPRAFDDDGDHAAGSRDALAAADELHQVATLIDEAEDRLDVAMSAAGRIAWHHDPATEQVPVRRWISVVFLQGEEADEVLTMIDNDGTDGALDHLRGWDYGDETTDAAMENGHVYDLPPSGPLEREVRDGDYQMTYSHSFGHVALYRLHTIEPDDQLEDESGPQVVARPSPRLQSVANMSWFGHSGVAAAEQQPGLGL